MDDIVSIADVERKLSFILRGASEGQNYVVVSNGRPVARIVPADTQEL
ncbi:type II toxin-antitoxin system prevent-host-death family antitoxin [Mesorhizobium sp. B2-8-3]|nr:type II toxin-antitoxin system prevent-host-death family antitoxin [Mesorhizobium sp. B2-8-3]